MPLPTQWIFLRGLSREQNHWGNLPQRCSDELGWHCIHLDLPGFGSENTRLSPLTIPAIRRDLQARNPLKDNEPFGIIALSLGGMVALDWLTTEPQRITCAILINSSTADCPPYYRLRPGNIWSILQSLGSRSIKQQERRILSMVSNLDDPGEHLADWYRIRQQRPVRKHNVIRQLLAAAHYRSPQKDEIAQTPVFIASRADRMVSWKCSERLANKYSAELILHDSAGHDLALDDPNWLLNRFKQLIAEHG